MKWLNRLATIAAAIVVIVAGLSMWEGGPLDRLFSLGALERVDFRTLQRSPNPNQYLVCPAGYCPAAVNAVSPTFDVPVEALAAAWHKLSLAEPRVVALGDASGLYRDYVQRSALMRYPDVISVEFFALGPTQSTIAIYSRSLYGRSDFGVNEKRIVAWLGKLPAALKATKA